MPTFFRVITMALGLALLTPAQAQVNAEQPDQMITRAAGKILTKIDANYDAYSADPSLLAQVIRDDLIPLLDMNYAARLILGRSGRSASDQQIDAFTQAMSNLLVDRYSSGLMNFRSEEQLEVLPVRGELNERATRVRTRVKLNDGGYAPVDYVFRKTADGWKAFDVIIEGISYVSTYRNQIIPEVESNGLDSVIQRLNSGELQLEN
jgi:phospholipid transport system substrate-binding protein